MLKLAAVIAPLCLALPLAACGGGDSPSKAELYDRCTLETRPWAGKPSCLVHCAVIDGEVKCKDDIPKQPPFGS